MLSRLWVVPLVLTAVLPAAGCRDHYVISERTLTAARTAATTMPPDKIAVAVERDLQKDRDAPRAQTYLRLSGLETGSLLRSDQERRRVSIVNRERGRKGGGTLLGFGATMVGGGLLIGVGAHLLIPGAVLVAQTSGPPREVPSGEPGVTYLP